MRLAALLLGLVACGPKVSTQPPSYDDEHLASAQVGPDHPPDQWTVERPVAPPGKGMRTGTIARDKLVAVLDAGPGSFLRQLEVSAKMNGDRFVGWELVQLVGAQTNPLYDVDLVPGDVLLAINGTQISHPDHLQTVWTKLRTANVVTAQLWRGETKLDLEFAIEPPLAP